MGDHSLDRARWVLITECVAIALTACLPQAAAERPHVYAIQGAHVVPMPGQEMSVGTVVIRDGLIVAVGDKVTIPPDAVVIDGDGLWVYSGLIDAGIELALEGSGQSSAPSASGRPGRGGATQAPRPGAVHELPRVHPEKRAVDQLLSFDSDRKKQVERYRELGFTAGLVAPEEGIFRGSSTVILLRDETPVAEMILANDVAQHLSFERGRFGQGYPSSLMGAVATIRQVLLDANRYAVWLKRYESEPTGMARPESVAAFEALADMISGKQPAIFHVDSPYDLLLADQIADEFELQALVVASGYEWEIADQVAATNRPLVLSIAFPKKPQVKDDDEALDISLREMRRYIEAPSAPVRLHDAGVEFALTTRGLKTLSDFKKNLDKMIEAGLAEDTALAALTTVPAKMLGIDRVVGTIEPGKIANLVVFDGPMFHSESATKKVFVDGREYRMEEKKKPQGGDPNATADPLGEWSVVFDFPGRSVDRKWVIEGEAHALTGNAETQSGTVSFESVSLTGNMLTVVFPAEGGRGAMELTVVVTGDSFEGSAEFGPRTVSVSGSRTSGPDGGGS